MCVQVHLRPYACGGQRLALGCLLLLPHLVCETESLQWTRNSQWLDSVGSSLLSVSRARVADTHCYGLLWYWCQGSKLRNSCLQDKQDLQSVPSASVMFFLSQALLRCNEQGSMYLRCVMYSLYVCVCLCVFSVCIMIMAIRLVKIYANTHCVCVWEHLRSIFHPSTNQTCLNLLIFWGHSRSGAFIGS